MSSHSRVREKLVGVRGFEPPTPDTPFVVPDFNLTLKTNLKSIT